MLLALIFASPACVKRSRVANNKPNEQPSQATQKEANDGQPGSLQRQNQSPLQRININTASAKELEQLPGIGEGFAARIVEHREKYGSFRRPEHLIIVRGISDRRFRSLRDLITVE